jgi:hypothetical protein
MPKKTTPQSNAPFKTLRTEPCRDGNKFATLNVVMKRPKPPTPKSISPGKNALKLDESETANNTQPEKDKTQESSASRRGPKRSKRKPMGREAMFRAGAEKLYLRDV